MAAISGIGGSTGVQGANGVQPGAPARADAAQPQPVASPPPATESPAGSRAQALALKQSADRVQEMLASAAPNLSFSVDKDSGRTVIKVVDPATHEVLRQIPAEEILRMSKNLDEMIARLKGLLIDRHG